MRLKEIRDQAGLTQVQAAKALGLTQPAYSRYESGARKPSFKLLFKLADFYNVTIDYILGYSSMDIPQLYRNIPNPVREANTLRLKELRKQAGLTQEQVAQSLGLP
jgi:transcriptional regulator with XRE-family HTH domain